MDLFYNEVPMEKKQRVHFHSFMLDVHSSMFVNKIKLMLLFYATDNTILQTDDNEDGSYHRVMEIHVFPERVMMTLRLVMVVFVVGVKAVNNNSFITQHHTEICPHLSKP